MIQPSEHICPRCGAAKMKDGAELDDDERFTADRLELSADYTRHERKKHRFCTRCWFEEVRDEIADAQCNT